MVVEAERPGKTRGAFTLRDGETMDILTERPSEVAADEEEASSAIAAECKVSRELTGPNARQACRSRVGRPVKRRLDTCISGWEKRLVRSVVV